jgi:ubiquinone/menaquinone biosynthesis C-methylase UbiE
MGFYAEQIFSRVMDWALRDGDVAHERRRALAAARGNVLEIGFGTGLNLSHYPAAVSDLTVIDSEQMLQSRVAKRIAEARVPVKQFHLDASGRLPFDDASFDSVVTTFTLCSISDVDSALTEMRRVLRSDGQYIFLEHGRSDNTRVARLQDLLNPVQRVVACGCNLNRPIDRLIRENGFRLVELERYLMPGMPRVVGELYKGVARRGAN